MNIDAFIFLQRSDIAHFASVSAAFEGLPQLFIDPGLLDEAIQRGLNPQTFDYRALDVGQHLQSRVNSEALTRASGIDDLLAEERRRLFGEGLFPGWDQGTLRLFFIRALMAKYLGQVCDRSFAETSIGLFRPRKPQQFYFDSFLATDLFASASDRFQVVDHYEHTLNWTPEPNAMCFDFVGIRALVEAGQAEAVTHIPTCYHHLAQYGAEISRAFATNIDLPSPFWDISVRRQQLLSTRVETLPSDYVDPICLVYRERARRVLEDQLGALVPGRQALIQQVELLAQRCYVQAINYLGLRKALHGSRPHFVITDHDTGSNGPLFSVAERLGSDVTVLPHSSYATGTIPHLVNVRVVERSGFGTPVRSIWGERVPTRPVRLAGAVARVERSKVKVACLLLNTMFSQGLSHIDLAGIVSFHRALAELCARHGVTLLVRLKPNGAALPTVAQALHLTVDDLSAVLRAPIEKVAAITDLCISYGEPTTASIEFLDCASFLIHASEQFWPSDYPYSPAYVGDATVPSYGHDRALTEISRLLVDESFFRSRWSEQEAQFRRRQDTAVNHIFSEPLEHAHAQ